MLRLLADENFNNAILRGLWLRNPELDIVRVQDVGLSGEEDPVVLDWASREGRVLLTHDKRRFRISPTSESGQISPWLESVRSAAKCR